MKSSDYIDMFNEALSTGSDSVRELDLKGEIQERQKLINVPARRVPIDNNSYTICKISDAESCYASQMNNLSYQMLIYSDLRNIQRGDNGSNILKDIVDCSSSPCKNMNKDKIENRGFSDAIVSRLGYENVVNTFGIPYDLELSQQILSVLVNYEAFISQHNKYISALLNFRSDKDKMYGNGRFDKIGNFTGNINNVQHTDIIRYAQDFIGPSASYTESIAFLLKLTGISVRKIFKMSLDRHACSIKRQLGLYRNLIHRDYTTSNAYPKNNTIHVDRICNIKGSDGNILSAYVCCRMGNTKFILPATMSQGELSIGKVNASCYPLNLDKLLHCPQTTAVLFCNPFDAIAYQDILDKTVGYQETDFIVTCFLGNDPSVWITNSLDNRKIVVVPPLNKTGAAYALGYQNWLSDHAKEIKYHCGFLLHYKPNVVTTEEELNEGEEALFKFCEYISDIENPVPHIESIISNACNRDMYSKWGVNCGIFKRKNIQSPSKDSNYTCKKLAMTPEMNEPPARSLNDTNLFHLFRPGMFTLIEGEKDAGKTRFAFHVLSSLIYANKLFDLFPVTSTSCRVLYLDIETLDPSIEDMKDSYGLNDIRFKILYNLDPMKDEYPEFCKNFTLEDEDFRNGLRQYILDSGYHYLVIDHASGFLNDRINQDHYCGIVYNWIQSLLEANVCVIMIHHLNTEKNKQAANAVESGSKKFRKHAHTILHIVSLREILERNDIPEIVKHAALEDGNTFGINFKVCKLAPILSGYTLWIHQDECDANFKKLSLTNRANKEVEINSQPKTEHKCTDKESVNGCEQHTDVNSTSSKEDSECTDTNKHSLTDNEQKIIDYIRQKGSIQTHEAQELLGFNNRQNATYHLYKMCAKGIIRRNGKPNRKSAYLLPD